MECDSESWAVDETNDMQVKLIQLWNFGDAYSIPKLQSEVLDTMMYLTSISKTEVETIQQAFILTSDGSPVRKLFAAQAPYFYFNLDAMPKLTEEGLESLALVPGFMKDFITPVRRDMKSAQASGHCESICEPGHTFTEDKLNQL